MARARQIVLLSSLGTASEPEPLGSLNEVRARVERFNVSADGSGPEGVGERLGLAILHGPGFILEVPSGSEEVSQLLATINDENHAWPVLMRLTRELKWKMMDPESGRTFGG
ncbi:MAG: hypothetical protein JNM07_10345 [Phycisphaerae bacterium]|nr:hypothetical protein [Phycisphaerae bacterium]